MIYMYNSPEKYYRYIVATYFKPHTYTQISNTNSFIASNVQNILQRKTTSRCDM